MAPAISLFQRAAAVAVKGTEIGTFPVGSVVTMNVAGTAREFIIVHQGLPSSNYDNSCDGTWLLMQDIYEKDQFGSSGNYEDSIVHINLNGVFLSLFDTKIQAAMKQVKIPYVTSDGSAAYGSSGLLAKIFLLSFNEVGLGSDDADKLGYFVSGTDVNACSARIAYLDGTASSWWLRSKYYTGAYVRVISKDGSNTYGLSTSFFGIRPALVLPSTQLVNDTGFVLA